MYVYGMLVTPISLSLMGGIVFDVLAQEMVGHMSNSIAYKEALCLNGGPVIISDCCAACGCGQRVPCAGQLTGTHARADVLWLGRELP